MQTKIYICCLFFILMSCKHQQVEEETGAHITIFESSCEGFCPVYTLDIFSNGKANYKGDQNVLLLGEKEYQFSKESTDSLFSLVKEIDFDELKDNYSSPIPDLPGVIINYKNKRISIKGFNNVPKELADLVIKLKELAYRTKYVK